jgi:membrane protease YdiL (CAAX protease family)
MVTQHVASTHTHLTQACFSLPRYLLVVFAMSWPFQGCIFFWPDAIWASKMLLVSMVMVTVGTYIARKYLFHDTFADAGWRWGKPRHYLAAFVLPVFLWVVPTLIAGRLGMQPLSTDIHGRDIFTDFLLSLLVTLIPAFGEEFGWRGYLLPRLLQSHSVRNALLIHAGIWWAWHLPVLIFAGMHTPVVEGKTLLSVTVVLLISLIPSMMHAVVFAYFWSASSSLAVATVYHAAFDEIRDTTERAAGISPFANLWQMVFLTLLGVVLLVKGRWEHLHTLHWGANTKHNDSVHTWSVIYDA